MTNKIMFCETGKRPFTTKHDCEIKAWKANGTVKRDGKYYGATYRAYKCPICSFWHLTTKVQKRN